MGNSVRTSARDSKSSQKNVGDVNNRLRTRKVKIRSPLGGNTNSNSHIRLKIAIQSWLCATARLGTHIQELGDLLGGKLIRKGWSLWQFVVQSYMSATVRLRTSIKELTSLTGNEEQSCSCPRQQSAMRSRHNYEGCKEQTQDSSDRV